MKMQKIIDDWFLGYKFIPIMWIVGILVGIGILIGCETQYRSYEMFREFKVETIVMYTENYYTYSASVGGSNNCYIQLPAFTKSKIRIDDVIQVVDGYKDNKYFLTVSKLVDGEYKEVYNQDSKE